MRGPYRLTPNTVNMRISDRMVGIYGLGNDPTKITVIGRAETKLRDTIKSFWKLHQFFWYEAALSQSDAYRLHCREYHRQMEQGDLEDKTHPTALDSDTKCPVCGHKG